MQVERRTTFQISNGERALWREWQGAMPIGASPFLAPEFAEAVFQVRSDVELAVIRRDDRLAGFWVYQRGTGGRARPLASGLSEWHGPILAPTRQLDLRELVTHCRLRSWAFDHAPPAIAGAARYARVIGSAPFADLREGYSAYREALGRSSKVLSKIERAARKLERDAGPLRFELMHDAPEVLRCLIAWKGAKHRRTGVPDIFQLAWICRFFEELLARAPSRDFAAMGSCLLCGDRPIAVHVGLRTASVAHWWFPAFDTEFHTYSPGLILLARWLESVAALGVTRADFGPGSHGYKERFRSGDLPVAMGDVYCSAALQRWGRVAAAGQRLARAPTLAGLRATFRAACDAIPPLGSVPLRRRALVGDPFRIIGTIRRAFALSRGAGGWESGRKASRKPYFGRHCLHVRFTADPLHSLACFRT